MAKRNRIEVENAKIEIRRLITEGFSKEYIRRAMKMPDRTFKWYMHQIFEEDKKFISQERDNMFMHYARNAIESFEKSNNKLTILQNEAVNRDNLKLQAEVEQIKRNNSIDILRILRDGLGAEIGTIETESGVVSQSDTDTRTLEVEQEDSKLSQEV